MNRASSFLAGGVVFLRRTGGIVTRPYETYRSIIDHSTLWELPFIALVLIGYFAIASLVKTAAFRPYLLTKQFVFLGGTAVISFMLVVATLWVIGRFFGGKGKIERLVLAWAYTLIPTTAWFFVTSVLYVLLPPPRTESWKGITFSILYLVFTITLFWWKIMLYYLTLRFGLRLDLKRITVVTLLAIPLFLLYSILMYRFGIFRIPFI